MQKTAIYARISEDRLATGAGVDRQLKECRTLVQQRDLGEVFEFVDNDTSATSGAPRPAYSELLAAIQQGRVGTVVAWHTDRLYRLPRDLEPLIALAEERGLRFHTVKAGDMDLDTASGRMVARILASVSAQEVEHKVERQRAKNAQTVASGKPLPGNRPFGYEKDRTTLREKEAEVVRQAAKAVLAGRSLGSIVAQLNDAGVKTSRGKTWNATSLRKLLLRPRNVGDLESRGHVVKADAFAPIFDRTTAEALHAVLTDSSRNRAPGKSRAAKYAFTGLARCGVCGGPMYSATSRSRGVDRGIYRCKTALAGHPSIDRRKLDAIVLPRLVSALLEALAAHAEPDEVEAPELAAMRAQVAALRQRREQAQEVALMPGADMAHLRRVLDEVAEEEAVLEGKIAQAVRGGAQAAVLAQAEELLASAFAVAEAHPDAGVGRLALAIAESDARALYEGFAARWAALPVADKRAILRATVRVTVNTAAAVKDGAERVQVEALTPEP